MFSAGNPFPNFSLPNQDGKITKLSDFAGHWLVVYFYPKDDTPICTIQGKSFTATKAEFDAAGIKVWVRHLPVRRRANRQAGSGLSRGRIIVGETSRSRSLR